MTIQYEIGANIVGGWFVYDIDACYCCAGPMSHEDAVAKKAELEQSE